VNLDTELAERFAAQAAAAAERRRQRAEQRRQFTAARDAGLRQRHASKTAKTTRSNR
jgi:hypothetical protein